MRERTWLTTTDPEPMLRFLKDRATDRKARLLVYAANRLAWDDFSDERSRRAIEVGEMYADGKVDDETRLAARDDAWDAGIEVWKSGRRWAPLCCLHACDSLWDTVELVLGVVEVPRQTVIEVARNFPVQVRRWWRGTGKTTKTRRPSPEAWCRLIRDIVPNPFRPVAFDPRWRTADTVGLARGIYEDRAFDRLPLLADALHDAGCADEQVLGHCRSDGHVRGCWLIDLVLNKS